MKRAKNVKKVESKLGPRLRQSLVQACCTTELDKALTQKRVFFVFILSSDSLQKEEELWIYKKEKWRKLGTKFWLKKGYFWTKIWLYDAHIYIYIYGSWPICCPHFCPQTVRSPINGLKKGHFWGPKFWPRFFQPLFFVPKKRTGLQK